MWLDGGVASESSRAVDFDAWVAGRSAALTRFAYLLAGNEVEAEAALRSALARACATWSRVRRADDPEAEVRRLVVSARLSDTRSRRRWRASHNVVPDGRRASAPAAAADAAARAWQLCASLSPAQRAAVVLRHYQDMNLAQIAGALDCSEAAARDHIQRTFAALRATLPKLTDAQLESALRDALVAHADNPSDHPDRAAEAHSGVRRRRRRQAVVAAVASTIVVSTAALVAPRDGGSAPAAAEDAGVHPRGWRAESYNGIQLWVPSSWGWGESPRRTSQGVVHCGFGAYSPTPLTANLQYLTSGRFPAYVGRPVAPRGSCPPPLARAAHVWFDSPRRPESGPAQTTVRVRGLTPFNITVADRDLVERRMILRSVQPVATDANGCPSDEGGLRRAASRSLSEPNLDSLETLAVCVYEGGSADGETLSYSTRLEGPGALSAMARIEAAPSPLSADACLLRRAPTRIVLLARLATGLVVFDVYPGSCTSGPVRYVTGPTVHVVTRETEPVWVTDGLSIYASSG